MAHRTCYFTVEGGRTEDSAYTSGTVVLARFHVHPVGGGSFAVRDVRVHFRGQVSTQISYRSEGKQDINNSNVYLFEKSTTLVPGDLTVTEHQAWDISVPFPWVSQPHPSQEYFTSDPFYAQQAEHRLPPSWWIQIGNDFQRVNYYLEAEFTRPSDGRNETHRLPLQYMPPLDLLDPPPEVQDGKPEKLERISRALITGSGSDSSGFRKRFFSSDKDPRALFHVSASVPSVCCMDEDLPVVLHLKYDQQASTAPQPPEVKLSFLHARVASNLRFRVVPNVKIVKATYRNQDSEQKKDVLKQRVIPMKTVTDGMDLGKAFPMRIDWKVGISFASFTVRRWFTLKISAIFECAGKQYDIVIAKHDLEVHPPRSLYRAVPPGPLNPGQVPTFPTS